MTRGFHCVCLLVMIGESNKGKVSMLVELCVRVCVLVDWFSLMRRSTRVGRVCMCYGAKKW